MALFNFVDSFTVTYGLRSAGADASEISYLYGIYGRGLTLVQITTVLLLRLSYRLYRSLQRS